MATKFFVDDRMEVEVTLNAATAAAFNGQSVAVEFSGNGAQWMSGDEFIPAFYPNPKQRNEAWDRLMQ